MKLAPNEVLRVKCAVTNRRACQFTGARGAKMEVALWLTAASAATAKADCMLPLPTPCCNRRLKSQSQARDKGRGARVYGLPVRQKGRGARNCAGV
jgi:hypothetical protein